ncbi:MAG: sodium:solute symporter family transporter [Polaribacter sp.]
MVNLFIIGYLLITLGIGFWASKKIKSSNDFALAGKSLSIPLVAVTLFATWFGSTQIMGNPGYFITDGFSAYISLIVTGGICLVVVGQFYAWKLYQMNIVTINEFFRIRYTKKLEITTSIIMVCSYPHWIAAQFVALAYLFNTVMGIPFHYGILLGVSIVVFYTYIGGMWAVAYTDMVQSVMILLGLIILLAQVLGETKGVTPIFSSQSSEFFYLTPKGGIDEWSDYIALLLAFTAGAIPVQEIYQRVFSAKSERSARNGLFLGAILMVVIPSIPLLIGLGGVYFHPELTNSGNSQDIIPTLVKTMTSITVQEFFEQATINPNALLIKGVICGYRIEDIERKTTREARYMDKLVDELAKGRKMEKILRQG